MERYLELHNEFRHQYALFHMADGAVLNSRQVNWRRVEWERVVRIDLHVRTHVHTVTCEHPTFQFFLFFRAAEYTQSVQGSNETRRTDYWLLGWSDGATAFLREVNHKTGELRRHLQDPLHRYAGHIHPRVQGTRATAVRGTRTQEELGY